MGLCLRRGTLSWMVLGLLLEGTVLRRMLGPVLVPVDRLVLLLLRGFGVGLRVVPGWVLPVVLALRMRTRWSRLWGPLYTLLLEGILSPRPSLRRFTTWWFPFFLLLGGQGISRLMCLT